MTEPVKCRCGGIGEVAFNCDCHYLISCSRDTCAWKSPLYKTVRKATNAWNRVMKQKVEVVYRDSNYRI